MEACTLSSDFKKHSAKVSHYGSVLVRWRTAFMGWRIYVGCS